MSTCSSTSRLSPRRAELASFEHAYVVALRMRAETGRVQIILRTGHPLQPYRVVPSGADAAQTKVDETVLALVA